MKNKFLLSLVLISLSVIAYGDDADTTAAYGFHIEDSQKPEFMTLDQLQATAFLNECVNTLARIEESNSKIVLEDELHRLNNVLGWKNATDFQSVILFRTELQSGLNNLIVNQIDRERFIKKIERQRNNAAKDAFLGAISGVQLNVNMISIISNVLISSARAAMDYNKRKNDLAVELDDELWKLEKEEREELVDLWQHLLGIYNEVYSKFNLENEMSLTFDEVAEFNDILAEQDNKLKAQRLVDKSSRFRYFSPYWYERGCAYIDLYEESGNKADLQEAWESFEVYENLYNNCVLYRYDYRTGMIALYKLRYMDNQPLSQKRLWADTVLQNIFEDGNALLYVALEYINTFDDIDGGYDLMRKILSNKKTSAHNEVLLTAAAYWDDLNNTNKKDLFIRAVAETDDIDLDAYIAFLSKIEHDKTIDTFKMKLKLQSSVSLTPLKYCDDENIWGTLTLKCDNNVFWFDNTGWNLVMDMHNEKDEYTQYSFNLLPKDFKDKFFPSYADAEKKLKKKVDYFDIHPNDITLSNPFSTISVNGKIYYYLSKNFNDIAPYLIYMDKESDGDKIPKKDRRESIENSYSAFCEKYLVTNLEYVYYLSDSRPVCMTEAHNDSKYTYIIEIPQGEDYNIDLCFEVDYIEENNPTLYFSGVAFNDDYIRF